MSKTQVAVQSRGPGNTHREGTDLQLGSPAMRMRVAVCLHMQTNVTIFNTYTHPTDPLIAHNFLGGAPPPRAKPLVSST